MIEQDYGVREAKPQVSVVNQLLNALFLEQPVHIGEFFRQVRIENDAADGGLDELALHSYRLCMRHVLIVVGGGQVNDFARIPQANWREQFDLAGFERENHVLSRTENAAFALGARLVLGEVINPKN